MAVLLVMLYHAGVPLLKSGFIGVDVFFVISGFLITGLLFREVQESGRVRLARFWGRRARRLLPAAGLVLVFVAVATRLVFPNTNWRAFGLDGMSASFYFVNWRLAAQSVDYLAQGIGASPVQHFWSLAVEEQFYVVWPLVLVVFAAVVRWRRWANVRAAMTVGLSLIVIPSFVWSIVMTTRDAGPAFFVTTTRLWELGIGGLVALGVPFWQRIRGRLGPAIGIVGLAGILASGVLLAHVAWPSWWAGVPVVSSALVIVGGTASAQQNWILCLKPLVWIGGLSYSLYLWHWPVLIVAQHVFDHVGWLKGLALAGATFLPAWLSHRYVENKIRFHPTVEKSALVSLLVGLSASLLSACVALGLVAMVPPAAGAPSRAVIKYLGAGTLQKDSNGRLVVPAVSSAEGVTPSPADAVNDLPAAYARGCQVSATDPTPRPCTYGGLTAAKTIALVGDSKVLQWLSALDAIAIEHGYKLIVATKSSCAFQDGRADYANRSCDEYNQALLAEFLASPPDIVLTSNYAAKAYDHGGALSESAMIDGLSSMWKQLKAAGSRVVLLQNNPTPVDVAAADGQVFTCVAQHMNDLQRCAFSRQAGIDASNRKAQETAASAAGVPVIDLIDALCNAEQCPAVIGGVLVYRQGSHITDTYVRSCEEILDERLSPYLDA